LRHGKQPSDRTQLIVGKVTVLTIGVLSIVISILFQKIGSSFDIYMKIYSMTTPVLFIPVMFGMVYRKTPWWSGMVSASIGMTIILVMNAVATVAAGFPLERLADILKDVRFSVYGIEYGKFELNIFFGVVTTSVVFFITSRWHNIKEEDIARLAALDKDLRTPAYADDSPIDKKSIQSYKIVALLSGLIGILLIILSAFSGNSQDFLINLLTGLGALGFCGLFWFLSKRYV
jgi:Na+(H+)/acetate symporter ActP